MKRTPLEEGKRWLDQARADLQGGEALLAAESYHLACFVAQQVAEKALKAFLYAQGEEYVFSHSVEVLAGRAAEYDPAFGNLRPQVAPLDGYYVPARYPNSLPDSIPARVFGRHNAEEALSLARLALDLVARKLGLESG